MEEVELIAIDHKVLHSKVCSLLIHFLWDFPEGATFAILLKVAEYNGNIYMG